VTTPSTHLRLPKPSTSDAFNTAQLAQIYDLLDAKPGRHICTSGTRPNDWGTNQTGMTIIETDTFLEWVWVGDHFERTWPVGELNMTERTTDFTTANTAAQTALSCSVDVPDGGRSIHVVYQAALIDADNGRQAISLWRDTTQLREWSVRGKPPPAAVMDQGEGRSGILMDDGAAGGSHTYHLKTRAIPGIDGTVYLRASVDNPLKMHIAEV
jgi:hypothetical protein